MKPFTNILEYNNATFIQTIDGKIYRVCWGSPVINDEMREALWAYVQQWEGGEKIGKKKRVNIFSGEWYPVSQNDRDLAYEGKALSRW